MIKLIKSKTEKNCLSNDQRKALESSSNLPVVLDKEPRSAQDTKFHINLIRAVLDGAPAAIEDIDNQLRILEEKKEKLLGQRQVHIEMLEVAKKFNNK